MWILVIMFLFVLQSVGDRSVAAKSDSMGKQDLAAM
jgi:hypothetical protein